MRITNLVLWVQENKLSEKFYRKLGFKVTRSDDQHSIVKLGDFKLWLVNMRDEEVFALDSMNHDKGRGMYIYINVEDVDAKYSELTELELTPSTKPKNWDWGNREFILKDPDNYKICFWQSITT